MLKEFKKSEIIFREGDKGDRIYNVVIGKVGIYGNYGTENEQELAVIEAGHIFGELALMDTLPRSATAVALEECALEEIFPSRIISYFAEDPGKINFIIMELGNQLARLTDEYNEACETLDAMKKPDKPKPASLLDQIREKISYYQTMQRANQISRESYNSIVQTDYAGASTDSNEYYSPHTVIFKAGEPGRCMYAIHSGTVDIYTDYGTPAQRRITTLSENDFFGEIGLVGNRRRSATAVVSNEPARIETISPDDFKRIYDENAIMIEAIIRHLTARIRVLTGQYLDVCEKISRTSSESDLL